MDTEKTLRALMKAQKDVEPFKPLIRQAQDASKAVEGARDTVSGPLMREILETREKLKQWGPAAASVTIDRAVFEPPPAYEAEMAGTLAAMLDTMETAAEEQAQRDLRSEEREQRMADLTAQSVKWARVAAIVGIIAVVVAVIAILIST